MPFYREIRSKLFAQRSRERAVDGLKRLKQQFLDEKIPQKNVSNTLLIATWNIREFDSAKYGERCPESFFYIAEIIDHFDLVAIQEVRDDLAALKRLQHILGGWWKYIVTDVTLGTAGQERLAFLFDTRKVAFAGLAGELVLPDTKAQRAVQFARTPFICGFKAGWTEFNICTVHIYYGADKADDPRRIQEIRDLAKTLAAMARGGKRKIKSSVGDASADIKQDGKNLILLGDFNIFNRRDETFAALTNAGFDIPKNLQQDPAAISGAVESELVPGTDLQKAKHYDQIAYMARPNRFSFSGNAGVFDFQKSVFARDQYQEYDDLIPEKYLVSKTGAQRNPQTAYNAWRTHQMSDHLLMWAELEIDFSKEFLDRTREWQPDEKS